MPTELDLVISGGTVATGSDVVRCDVGINNGAVALLGENLAGHAREVIDATGRLVLPGGVDAHCHIDQESPSGLRHADDFYSGTRSAAGGGTTTIIPFANQKRGTPLRVVVDEYHRRAQRAVIDYAFHLIVCDPNEQVLGQELPALVREGYTSFKIYLSYEGLRLSDRQVLDVMAMAQREGALVMVHAENHDCIVWLTERLLATGKFKPRHHADAHSGAGEREATYRAIALSEVAGVPLFVVHVSDLGALEEIRRARQRGMPVHAETCPQYLVLTENDLDRPGFEGAKFVCSPPPRTGQSQEALWRGLADGTLEVFSSDHAPYRFGGTDGKARHGCSAAFPQIANGVPGLETRLPLLFSYGVQEGRIDLNTFVRVTATNPAKTYGLYPRKGTIAVGADADIVIWDPERTVTIRHDMLHDAMDYTPYEGMTVHGWPVMTLSRGEVVCRDGEVTANTGRGQFLRCETPEAARPRAPLAGSEQLTR